MYAPVRVLPPGNEFFARPQTSLLQQWIVGSVFGNHYPATSASAVCPCCPLLRKVILIRKSKCYIQSNQILMIWIEQCLDASQNKVILQSTDSSNSVSVVRNIWSTGKNCTLRNDSHSGSQRDLVPGSTQVTTPPSFAPESPTPIYYDLVPGHIIIRIRPLHLQQSTRYLPMRNRLIESLFIFGNGSENHIPHLLDSRHCTLISAYSLLP